MIFAFHHLLSADDPLTPPACLISLPLCSFLQHLCRLFVVGGPERPPVGPVLPLGVIKQGFLWEFLFQLHIHIHQRKHWPPCAAPPHPDGGMKKGEKCGGALEVTGTPAEGKVTDEVKVWSAVLMSPPLLLLLFYWCHLPPPPPPAHTNRNWCEFPYLPEPVPPFKMLTCLCWGDEAERPSLSVSSAAEQEAAALRAADLWLIGLLRNTHRGRERRVNWQPNRAGEEFQSTTAMWADPHPRRLSVLCPLLLSRAVNTQRTRRRSSRRNTRRSGVKHGAVGTRSDARAERQWRRSAAEEKISAMNKPKR